MSTMLPNTVRKSLETHTIQWNQNLTGGSPSSDKAIAYLSKRGFTRELVDKYCIGLVDTPAPETPHVAGRVSIPYLTRSGPVSMKFRCIDHNNCKTEGCKAKYLTWPKTGTWLFNAQTVATATGPVVLTEGELDALAVEGLVGVPAVAYPGADSWEDHFPRVFDGAVEVVVVADGDKPGRDAARHVAGELARARVVNLPDGWDSNSVIVGRGVDVFREMVGV